MVSPFGSDEPVPSSVTVTPSSAVTLGPAFAIGASLILFLTVILTESDAESAAPSLTFSENMKSVAAVTLADVKVGF